MCLLTASLVYSAHFLCFLSKLENLQLEKSFGQASTQLAEYDLWTQDRVFLFSLYELYIKRKMFKWKLNCIYWAPVGGKEVILAPFWLWWRRAVWPRKDSCKYCASYGKEAHPVTLLLRSPCCQGHVWLSCIDHSEVSIQVMWSVLTNQEGVKMTKNMLCKKSRN